MRIIAGEFRSRTLLAPKGMDTRPTLDRTRESLFNIISAECPEARVLDLYAGSGALALEALSRGAASAVLCDKSREAARVIAANIASLKVEDRARLLAMSDQQAVRMLQQEGVRFDLVFLDPPYRGGLYGELLDRIKHFDKLQTGGIMVVETPADIEPDSPGFPYVKLRSYRYGKVRLTTFSRNEDEV